MDAEQPLKPEGEPPTPDASPDASHHAYDRFVDGQSALDQELGEAVAPPRPSRRSAWLAMGAVAARALFGNAVRVTKDHGRILETEHAELGAVTIHPSAVLRRRERDERELALAELAEDLVLVEEALRGGG